MATLTKLNSALQKFKSNSFLEKVEKSRHHLMKKNIFWITLVLLALTLSACASTSGTRGPAANGNAAAVELPTQAKVTIGILKLENTDTAVTAEQATELLPMFYVLQDLNDSDIAAQEEIDGLVNQIQETLTQDQVQAIDDISLSMRDIFSYSQANSGVTSSSTASSANSANGGGVGGPPDMGSMPSGAMPDAGMPSSGTTSSPTSGSASSAAPSMSNSTPSALFDSVIELLQKKISS